MGKKRAKAVNQNQNEPTPGAKRTLFLRNLDFNVTSDGLTNVFKEYGPIQSCFVVSDSLTKKSRGIGYVKFTDSNDAAKAMKSVKLVEGRKVFISFANSKSQTESKKSDESTTISGKSSADESQRLIVRNLPFSTTEQQVKQWLSAFEKNVTLVELPTLQGKGKGYGFICLDNKESGEQAISSLNQTLLGGRNVTLDWFLKDSEFNKLSKAKSKSKSTSNPVKSKTSSAQTHRLIIRNLPFQVTEDVLKKSLSQFGEISNIEIPKDKKGKKKGFAFFTSDSKECGQRVIQELKAVNGRPVAVDWALEKSVYVSKLSASEDTQSAVKSTDGDSQTVQPSEGDEQTSEEDEQTSEGDEQTSEGEEESAGSEMSETESHSESDSEDDSADEYEDMKDENDSGVSDSEKKGKKIFQKGKEKHKSSSADINQERTLFLRNVSYDTTEDQLIETFSQFGDVTYVKVLVDPQTERSKGMAFVQFDSKEDTQRCLAASEDPQQLGKLFVDGRDLNVALAVSRERIGEINKSKEKQPKDKRNLYLAREGLIREGTEAAQGVSKMDMNKRMKLEGMMREKLKNPLIFISPFRLCIHNLPTKLADRQLKAICLKAADAGKAARIVECRIMRDLTRVNSEGIGRSRGYAFVAFTEHSHALAALRGLNNNPDIFSSEKRPIVEFSLENTKALQAKEKRLQTLKNSPKKASKVVTSGSQAKVERPEGVKPGLPSHHGPKVRHKPRPISATDPKKQARLERKRKEQEMSRREKEENKQPKPKKQRTDLTDSFDSLVDTYRAKLTAGVTAKAKSKWYE